MNKVEGHLFRAGARPCTCNWMFAETHQEQSHESSRIRILICEDWCRFVEDNNGVANTTIPDTSYQAPIIIIENGSFFCYALIIC